MAVVSSVGGQTQKGFRFAVGSRTDRRLKDEQTREEGVEQMAELGVNKVVLVGRSGGNAELKFTAGGKLVASFSIAVNESFKTRDGKKNDHVEWFRCVCWNRLAEVAGQYVTTGKLLFIEGRLQTRKYDDREGNARKVIEVIVSQLRLLAGGNGSANGERTDGATSHQRPTEAPEEHGPMDSDVPF
jgi:single-strand DNA-binding protein